MSSHASPAAAIAAVAVALPAAAQASTVELRRRRHARACAPRAGERQQHPRLLTADGRRAGARLRSRRWRRAGGCLRQSVLRGRVPSGVVAASTSRSATATTSTPASTASPRSSTAAPATTTYFHDGKAGADDDPHRLPRRRRARTRANYAAATAGRDRHQGRRRQRRPHARRARRSSTATTSATTSSGCSARRHNDSLNGRTPRRSGSLEFAGGLGSDVMTGGPRRGRLRHGHVTRRRGLSCAASGGRRPCQLRRSRTTVRRLSVGHGTRRRRRGRRGRRRHRRRAGLRRAGSMTSSARSRAAPSAL